MKALLLKAVEALKQGLRIEELGRREDVHWESLRDMRRAFHDQQLAAIADLEAAIMEQPGEAWQPIETAPKNTRSRLVWCPERNNTYAVVWDERDDTWSFWGGGGTLTEEPTYWQPMPPPPGSAVAPLKDEGEAREPWEPSFDVMSPKQEELVRQFCAEIAGPRGQRGSPPDPVRLLEMAQALYVAERDDMRPGSASGKAQP